MLRNNAFYISVLAPVAAILFVNLTVLLVVMVKLHNHGKRKQIGPFSRLFADTRIAFTGNVLLGCTWVFALFAVGKAITIFQWFFCIFNSLQGFFIFLFYVVRNPEVQNLGNRMLSSRSEYPRKLEEISTTSLQKGELRVVKFGSNKLAQFNLSIKSNKSRAIDDIEKIMTTDIETIDDIEKIMILTTDIQTICITSQIWNLLNIEFPFL